jgi:esterase/lipase/1-acyl-sn-glycerol-3-phosphate acyltransferase
MSETVAIRIARFVLSYFDRIFKNRLKIIGENHIPSDKTIIFTPNHFTRFETLFVPYIVDKLIGKSPMSLADSGLFLTFLRPYLERLKAISTGDPKRNEIMINNLVSGTDNWVIYPEGMMVKDKHIYTHKTPENEYEYSAKTGTAVVAIQAVLEKIKQNKHTKDIVIVPVSITYFPILPKSNRIERLFRTFVKKVPRRVEEELLLEGGILEFSNIEIHFNKPIEVKDFVQKGLKLLDNTPLISPQKKEEMMVDRLRKKITFHMMQSIYSGIKISVSHILSILVYEAKDEVEISDLRHKTYGLLIEYYKSSGLIEREFNYIVNDYLNGKNSEFCLSLELFKTQGVVAIKNGKISPTKHLEYGTHGTKDEFSFIRIKNTARILYNEARYNKLLEKFLNTHKDQPISELKKFIFNALCEYDTHRFKLERTEVAGEADLKSFNFGHPRLIAAKDGSNSKGIVLSHGYKASPGEVLELANYLVNQNINVYLTRFKGHGTSAEAMKTTNWADWVNYFGIGYEIMNLMSQKVYLSGFSTGGLVALKFMQDNPEINVSGIIPISAAIKLNDIRFRLIKFAKVWFDIVKGKDNGYIDDEPEYPDTNYARNYVCCMKQLSLLMSEVEDGLNKVNKPVYVVYGTKDPVVSPQAAQIIFDKIGSNKKEIQGFERTSHVIIRGAKTEEIFAKIFNFINHN